MVLLTEKLILAKAKADSLEAVFSVNLVNNNITGGLQILRRMPNVETLSLSVNRISNLDEFQHCHKLRELYLRRNDVADVEETRHLSKLKQLKVLWLSENPCAAQDQYRSTVIRMIPSLHQLDQTVITDAERRAANEAYWATRPDASPSSAEKSGGAVDVSFRSPQQGRESSSYDGAPSSSGKGDYDNNGGQHMLVGGNGSAITRSFSTLPMGSPNVLYAVIALLQDLSGEALRVVQAEVERRLRMEMGQ